MSRKSLVIGVVLLVAADTQGAQSGTPGQTSEFLFSGVKDRIDRTRQGIVQAEGRKTLVHSQRGKHQAKVGFFLAFDHDANLIRFDNSDWLLSPKPDLPENRGESNRNGPMAPLTQRTKYFRTASQSGHYLEANEQLGIYRSEERRVGKECRCRRSTE